MGLFDVMGPIMIGPSSSHTAGAARIGFLAREVYGRPFSRVKVTLYNSFAETGKGHGTDRAIIGGLLGMAVDDVAIPRAFEEAARRGMHFSFESKSDPEKHPNTAEIVFAGGDGGAPFRVIGVSTGGGKIKLTDINGSKVDFSGRHNVLLLTYRDMPGMIGFIGDTLGSRQINIAYLSISRDANAGTAMAFLKLDGPCLPDCAKTLRENVNMFDVIVVSRSAA